MTDKHFYQKIAEIDEIKLEITKLDVSDEERNHLERLVDAHLHSTILDLILSELSEEDKKVFLDHLATDDQEKIWEHLSENIEDVEGKIKNAALELSEELKKDIETVK